MMNGVAVLLGLVVCVLTFFGQSRSEFCGGDGGPRRIPCGEL